MTNRNRSLGNSGENGIVRRVIEWGLQAWRQPGSGQNKGFPADVVIKTPRRRVLVESKVRQMYVTPGGKTTWTINFNWLRKVMKEADEGDKDGSFDHGALFVRPKGSQDRFVMLNEEDYLRLLSR